MKKFMYIILLCLIGTVSFTNAADWGDEYHTPRKHIDPDAERDRRLANKLAHMGLQDAREKRALERQRLEAEDRRYRDDQRAAREERAREQNLRARELALQERMYADQQRAKEEREKERRARERARIQDEEFKAYQARQLEEKRKAAALKDRNKASASSGRHRSGHGRKKEDPFAHMTHEDIVVAAEEIVGPAQAEQRLSKIQGDFDLALQMSGYDYKNGEVLRLAKEVLKEEGRR